MKLVMLGEWSLAIAIAIVLLSLAWCRLGHAECLHSAAEVWDAHPGSHATWKVRHEKKCWEARKQDHVASRRIPLPRPSPIRTDQTSADFGTLSQADEEFFRDRLLTYGWRLWLAESVAKAESVRARLQRSPLPHVVLKAASF